MFSIFQKKFYYAVEITEGWYSSDSRLPKSAREKVANCWGLLPEEVYILR